MADASVSTVIACYNGARFLGEAIESAVAQDYEPHQIVVVDDGSTDRSSEIARRFAAVTLARHEHNRGVSAARNTALGLATGDYIAILDADDRMLQGRLTAQLDLLGRDQSIGCVLGQQQIIAEPGVPLPDWARDVPKLNWREEGPDAPFYGASSAMFPRAALDRVGYYDEGLQIGEDLDLIFRLTEAGYRIATIEQPLIVRRVHGANLTGPEDVVVRSLPAVLSRRIARKRAAATS